MERKIEAFLTMFQAFIASVFHYEKKVVGIDNNVDRFDMAAWLELENNQEILEALVSENEWKDNE